MLGWGFFHNNIKSMKLKLCICKMTTHLGSSRIPPTRNGATFKLVLAAQPEGHQGGWQQSRNETLLFLDMPWISSSCRSHHWL